MKRYALALEQRIALLEPLAAEAPGKSLRIKVLSGKKYFYYWETDSGKRRSRYVSSKDKAFLQMMASKRYAREVLPCLKKNLQAARYFIAHHSGLDEPEAAAALDPLLLALCGKAGRPVSKQADAWIACAGSEKPEYGQRPSIETADGNMVRSKSEAFIYDALSRAGFVFSYERALYLRHSGITVFPDFTILNEANMKVIYWEHFGRMDDPEYVRKVCRRLSQYLKEGIIPGENLICTFEDGYTPLSPADVRKYISMIKRKFNLV